MTDDRGDINGWYTINATTTGCDWRTWHTLGWTPPTAAGVDLNAYTNVMFIWPPDPRNAGSLASATSRASTSYLNGTTSVQVMTHEVGHNFGLGHANARTCMVERHASDDRTPPPSCTTQDYADPFSDDGQQRPPARPRVPAGRARLPSFPAPRRK